MLLSDDWGFHFLRKKKHELSCKINGPYIKVNWLSAFVEFQFINKVYILHLQVGIYFTEKIHEYWCLLVTSYNAHVSRLGIAQRPTKRYCSFFANIIYCAKWTMWINLVIPKILHSVYGHTEHSVPNSLSKRVSLKLLTDFVSALNFKSWLCHRVPM